MSRIGDALVLIAVGAVLFFVGRATAIDAVITEEITEEITQTDTLYIRDTITLEKPVYTRVYVRDSVMVTDTIVSRDTIWLPREVKVYEDERFRAEVSGYEPSLDRIEIYVPERIVTQDKTQIVEVKKNARWGVGLQAGYGVGVVDKQVQTFPYIGVGISWNILTF